MTNNTIIPVLEQKLPEFVQDNYPNFVRYIKDYLSFLEQDGGFLRIIEDWKDNNEPTREVGPYIDAMLVDLGFESKGQLQVKRHVLAHTLRDFYLSRGTEASFQYLFRALFNESVSIRYPREEMLVPSNAEYGSRHFIFTSSANRNTIHFQTIIENITEYGGTLRGLDSGAISSIENISIIYGGGEPFFQIEILEPLNEFKVNEVVSILSDEIEIFEVVKPVIEKVVVNGGSGYLEGDVVTMTGASVQGSYVIGKVAAGGVDGVNILNGGSGYVVGDRISASSSDDGFGFSAHVSSVSSGAITGVEIINEGYNYTNRPTLLAKGGTGASLEATSSSIGAVKGVRSLQPYIGEPTSTSIITNTGTGCFLGTMLRSRWTTKAWENRRGFLGENSTLIDSDKYQQYSYTLVSPIPAQEYNDFVSELLHPVGYIRSNSFEIVSEIHLPVNPGYELDPSVSPWVYEHNSGFLWTLGYEVEIRDTPYIVAVDGMTSTPIVTDDGEMILAS